MAVDNGIAQLKSIEILAHPYLVLHHLWGHLLVLCRQGENHLVEFARQAAQVSSDGVGYQLRRFRVDTHLALLEILLNERWKVAITQFFALKQHASGLDGLDVLPFSAVNTPVFVTKDEDG